MKNNIYCLLIVVGLFFATAAHGVSAASLQFDPTTLNVTTGQSFQIKLDIDAGTAADGILATDAKITYDKALCQVTKIDNGTYFTTLGKADFATPGQVYVAAIVDDPGDFKKGTGTYATMTVTCNNSGTATFSYVCTPGETGNDSNIANNDFDATDVINCSENGTARVVIGGSSTGPTSTPSATILTPTETPEVTVEPTISSLPATGSFENTLGMGTLLPISIGMVIVGLVVKLLLR